jgi:2,4-dienoyl-CoA reductase-like NADH-dependent reductase (Old Yellow Enzyme family)
MTLFEPLTLRGLTLRNRIMMSPMSQRAALQDGRAGDWHLVHYGSRAVGGCGLVMVEDTAVAPLGRTSSSALGLYEQAQAQALGRIVSFCQSQGAAAGVQLAHAGRKALADRRGHAGALAASAVAFGPGWAQPQAASPEDLAAVVEDFVQASLMASEVGFDAVEIHAAHGYLLHQFLSPLTNLREDLYGGDVTARRRLLLEVVRGVRAKWPAQRPLFVRLPAGDGQAGGLGIEEMVDCARECLASGADLVDLSGGTPLLGGGRAGPPDVLAFAQALVGEIVDGASAEALLHEGHASLVSVGRPLLGDPYWPVRAALELGAPAPLSSAYAEALADDPNVSARAFGRVVSSPDHSKHVDDCTKV